MPILLFSPVQIIITHPLKALQKETSINILEGKIKKKTDSMKEVKALQKETSKASNSKPSNQSKGAPSKSAEDDVEKNSKPQIKMSVKNVKPVERRKKVNDSSMCNTDGSSGSECTKEKLQMKSNATKIKLIEVGNWEVEANANAKVPELSDEQPLPNFKQDLKPQIKMGVKNIKPAEKSKKEP